jgi:hypothetical protein
LGNTRERTARGVRRGQQVERAVLARAAHRDELLGDLSATERRCLLAVLARLAEQRSR